ncbi:hypothetical protein D3C81_1411640 [compost metagenome]
MEEQALLLNEAVAAFHVNSTPHPVAVAATARTAPAAAAPSQAYRPARMTAAPRRMEPMIANGEDWQEF